MANPRSSPTGLAVLASCLLAGLAPGSAEQPVKSFPVTFGKDLKFSQTYVLKKDDPGDLGRRYCEFTYALEKGEGFLIEISSAAFEPACIVFTEKDLAGRREDGGFSGKRTLRFVQHALQFGGAYRLR